MPESGFGFCREGSELFVAAAEVRSEERRGSAGVNDFFTTASPRAASRPQTTTMAPWAARVATMASPMPLVEPVTTAVFPARR